MPGWKDNFLGPGYFMHGIGKGVFRTIHVDTRLNIDIIPADIAINTIIVAAWQLAIDKSSAAKLSIYNCVSSTSNPITWGNFFELTAAAMRKNPLEDAVWYPFFILIKSQTLFKFVSYLFNFLPNMIFALLTDGLAQNSR